MSNTNTNTRSIQELEALKPVDEGSRLVYPGVNDDNPSHLGRVSMNEELDFSLPRISRLWSIVSSQDGVAAEAAAHELARIYLVDTARRINAPSMPNTTTWSERFAHASAELYGEPRPEEAAILLRSNLEWAETFSPQSVTVERAQSLITGTYQQVLDGYRGIFSEDSSNRLRDVVEHSRGFGEFFMNRFPEVFRLVDEEARYEAPEQLEVLRQAVAKLAEKYEVWESVSVLADKNAAHLSVNSRDPKNISAIVGMNRPSATGQELKGLLGHELLWHLTRGINGWETSDPLLGSGFPEGEAFEEGGGIYSEVGITGIVPVKHVDRYVDIALALGSIDGQKMGRKKLIEIAIARGILRKSESGIADLSDDDMAEVEKGARSHANRIYKGGTGDETEAGKAAVFTKDVIYYDGLLQMEAFYNICRNLGISIETVMDYLLLSKSNPLNPSNVQYQKDKYGFYLPGYIV